MEGERNTHKMIFIEKSIYKRLKFLKYGIYKPEFCVIIHGNSLHQLEYVLL